MLFMCKCESLSVDSWGTLLLVSGNEPLSVNSTLKCFQFGKIFTVGWLGEHHASFIRIWSNFLYFLYIIFPYYKWIRNFHVDKNVSIHISKVIALSKSIWWRLFNLVPVKLRVQEITFYNKLKYGFGLHLLSPWPW